MAEAMLFGIFSTDLAVVTSEVYRATLICIIFAILVLIIIAFGNSLYEVRTLISLQMNDVCSLIGNVLFSASRKHSVLHLN